METLTVTIEQDGSLRFIDAPEAAALAAALGVTDVRRASHVLPDNIVLRFAFNVLRQLFGDEGHIAEWTRHWRCLWLVDASPVGGALLDDRWRDRAAAIEAEVKYLNEYFLNQTK